MRRCGECPPPASVLVVSAVAVETADTPKVSEDDPAACLVADVAPVAAKVIYDDPAATVWLVPTAEAANVSEEEPAARLVADVVPDAANVSVDDPAPDVVLP